MNLKKLAEMAKIQSALDNEEETASPPIDLPEEDPRQFDIFIPIDNDNDGEPDRIPDDGFTPLDDNDDDSRIVESTEDIIEKCFPDEKAYNIELERLLPYHSPIFSDTEDISGLKSTIARIGITEPLLVKSAGSGEYEVLGGNRRKKAAEELLWTKVPCRIADNELLTDELEKQIVIENNLERLSTLRLTSERIRVCAVLGAYSGAEKLGITNEQAEKYVRLDKLDQEILKMLDTGALSFEAAETLSALNEKQQKQTLAVLAQHPEYKITSANAAELVGSKRFTADSIAKILKPKPPVNVAISAELISEYMNGKTPEELTEIISEAIRSYFRDQK